MSDLEMHLLPPRLDPDDWALLRVAELRAQGEQAKFRIIWCRDVRGRYRYDVQVRRSNGDVERLCRGPVEPEPERVRESWSCDRTS